MISLEIIPHLGRKVKFSQDIVVGQPSTDRGICVKILTNAARCRIASRELVAERNIERAARNAKVHDSVEPWGAQDLSSVVLRPRGTMGMIALLAGEVKFSGGGATYLWCGWLSGFIRLEGI